MITPGRRILLFLAVSIFSLFDAVSLPRLQDIIELEAVIFLDLVDGNPEPLPVSEAKQLLGREAAWLVAGAVYGFAFEYRPGDRARGIEELFILEPLPGEPERERFELPVFTGQDDRLRGRFVYHLADFEERRYHAWYSNIIPEHQGRGKAPLITGYSGKIDAHKDAVREALRGYYRTVSPNKPRLLKGTAAISSMPVTGIDGGDYVSTLRIRIRTESVTGYTDY